MIPNSDQRYYLGTMSGTSMDGLDIVAVDFSSAHHPRLLQTEFIAYPDDLKLALQSLVSGPQATIGELCQLDSRLGQFYATALNRFISDHQLEKQQISAIGSHGQTIRHQPVGEHPYSLQIGDPNIIAATTGLTVVVDFRRRDIALGGEGAPLAPAFHNQVFRSEQCNRAIINIGGIANITGLAADPGQPVSGFDTGPGNCLIDWVCSEYFARAYDDNGDLASTGNILFEPLQRILTEEQYFQQLPPKSTGTDYFSPAWLRKSGWLDFDKQDLLATLTELSAISISQGLNHLPYPVDECFVCGGGAHNHHLMHRLQYHLSDRSLSSTAELGIDPDWVEAMAFAWLARQTLLHQPGNLPSVTNAQKLTILGAVYFSNGIC